MACGEAARQARGAARCGASRKAGNAANARRKPPLKGPGLLGLGGVKGPVMGPCALTPYRFGVLSRRALCHGSAALAAGL